MTKIIALASAAMLLAAPAFAQSAGTSYTGTTNGVPGGPNGGGSNSPAAGAGTAGSMAPGAAAGTQTTTGPDAGTGTATGGPSGTVPGRGGN